MRTTVPQNLANDTFRSLAFKDTLPVSDEPTRGINLQKRWRLPDANRGKVGIQMVDIPANRSHEFGFLLMVVSQRENQRESLTIRAGQEIAGERYACPATPAGRLNREQVRIGVLVPMRIGYRNLLADLQLRLGIPLLFQMRGYNDTSEQYRTENNGDVAQEARSPGDPFPKGLLHSK
jgi:hypothetical protein